MRNVIFISFLLLLSACDIFNTDEDPVAFIRIEDMPLVTTNGQGSPSENIIDVWLNVDGDLIGVYELPVTIPVIRSGDVNVKVFAGVHDNGISTTRRRYPFYNFYETNVELIDEQVIDIAPIATYIPDALLFITEDFEDPGILFARSVTSDTTIQRIANPDPSDFLREQWVGAIYMDDAHDHFKVESTFDLDIAQKNLAYLELDYKCDGPFRVGIRSISPSQFDLSLIGFNPVYDESGAPSWNKVYIDLTAGTSILQNAEEYEIFLEADLVSTGTATYLFDNAKVIYPIQ